MGTTQASSVRKLLAAQTFDIHHALHHNPLLKQLLDSGLRTESYFAALAVFHSVFSRVEDARAQLGGLADQSLKEELDALRSDLAKTNDLGDERECLLSLENRHEVLGALYTCHGARFGASTILKNVISVRPDLPTAYFGLRPNVVGWRKLLAMLEAVHGDEDRASLVKGAQATFSAVQDATMV